MKHYPFLTLSGASGAGKTTLMEELIRRYPDRFDIFQSVTTRPRRPSDKEGAFRYLDLQEFLQWEREDKFAWVLEYSGQRYGTTKETIQKALRDPHTSISPIVPRIVGDLHKLVGGENVFSIYIPSLPEEVMRERMLVRGDDRSAIEERIIECAAWDAQARISDIPFHFVENTGTVDELVEKVLRLLEEEKK